MSTVLLVDDSPSDRALFRTILGRAGFSVHELSRGLEAVAKAREIRPHVVVLDVNLPDTDGHAVCRAIRADPVCAGLPVLMLTVRGHNEDVLAGLEAGADDYLPKDEEPEIILARVRRLVQFRKLATVSVLNEQLAQVGRLVAGIVHEIRAPLTVIRGNAELISLELADDPASSQWVEPILRSVKTLQLRLDHLMAAVRTGPSEAKPLDVVPLLRESVSLFLKGTDPRRGKVAVELQAEDVVPIVRADAGRMIQVVLNLLSNVPRGDPRRAARGADRRPGPFDRRGWRDPGPGRRPGRRAGDRPGASRSDLRAVLHHQGWRDRLRPVPSPPRSSGSTAAGSRPRTTSTAGPASRSGSRCPSPGPLRRRPELALMTHPFRDLRSQDFRSQIWDRRS